eukprot:COSAG01_NODE_7461_length_3203_cov_2.029317_4_plen_65_part_01
MWKKLCLYSSDHWTGRGAACRLMSSGGSTLLAARGGSGTLPTDRAGGESPGPDSGGSVFLGVEDD